MLVSMRVDSGDFDAGSGTLFKGGVYPVGHPDFYFLIKLWDTVYAMTIVQPLEPDLGHSLAVLLPPCDLGPVT